MHFLKRSQSFIRFKVVGKFEFFHEDFQKSLTGEAFRDLSDLPEDEESIGWVSPENCLEPPLLDTMLSEPYIKLNIRVDRRRIPAALLSAHIAIEERAALEASGRSKLSVNERREIKQSVKEFLIQKTPPTSALYRALWNFGNGTCFLFSTSKGVQARFCKLFRDTFELELEPLTPWTLSCFWAEKNNATKTLESLEASSFCES